MKCAIRNAGLNAWALQYLAGAACLEESEKLVNLIEGNICTLTWYKYRLPNGSVVSEKLQIATCCDSNGLTATYFTQLEDEQGCVLTESAWNPIEIAGSICQSCGAAGPRNCKLLVFCK